MISVKSRKAKGRRLQNWVRDTLLSLFPKLTDDDIYCAIMGERGVDIKLSKKVYYALGQFPVKGYKIYKYSPEETGLAMVRNKHWGPWDLKPPR